MSPAFPFSVPDPLFLQQVSTISTILSYRPRVGTEGQQLFGAHHCQRNTGTSSLSHLKTEMVHKAYAETAGSHALPTLARPQHLLSGGKIIHTVPGPSHAYARSKWSLTTWLLESCTRRRNSQRSEVYYVGKD